MNMRDDDLPDVYTPIPQRTSGLEGRGVVVYAIGIENKPGSYGMTDGPTPDLIEMLNQMPLEETTKSKIIRFNKDGTDEVLYFWSVEKSCWKRSKRSKRK